MMHNKDVTKYLWGETLNTACHIVNRVYFKPGTKKTPYELWKGRKPNVKYFRIFGSTYFILKDKENVWKFDTSSGEGIFLGYSSSSKAYRVFNTRTRKVMETMNVMITKPQLSPHKTRLIIAKICSSFSTWVWQSWRRSFSSFHTNRCLIISDPAIPPPPIGLMEREPLSRVKLNHPSTAIVGNMNELNLRKRMVDKYVAKFVSYSCYFLKLNLQR